MPLVLICRGVPYTDGFSNSGVDVLSHLICTRQGRAQVCMGMVVIPW